MKLFNRHVEDRFSAYLDSQLSEAENARFESHLSGCEYCRLQYEATRQSVIALRALPDVAVPRSFALNEAMLADAPARRVARASRWQPIAAPAAGFAVLALLLVGGDLATSTGEDDQDAAQTAIEASDEDLAVQSGAADSAAGGAADGEESEPATESAGEPAEESIEEESTEEEGAETDTLSDEQEIEADDGEDDSLEETRQADPDTADPEPAAAPLVEDIDEEDDNFRLYVRVLAGVAGAAALILGGIAFKRWLEQRNLV